MQRQEIVAASIEIPKVATPPESSDFPERNEPIHTFTLEYRETKAQRISISVFSQ